MRFSAAIGLCLSLLSKPAAQRLYLVLMLALAGLVPAGALAPAAAQSYSFTSFAVQGNQRVDDSTVLSFAGLSAGQSIDAAGLNDAYQQVLASGLFEEVEFVPQGARLLIRVVEFPIISRISVEGNTAISDERALAIITSQPRRVFNPAQVERDAAALTEAYRDEGRFSAIVTPRLIRRDAGRVDVVFEVQDGRKVEIERISFVGNRNFTDRRLRQVLETKQAGFLRALIRQDTFVEDRIEFDKRLLTDFYQARGFVDFQVLSVSAEFSRERNAFFLTFNLREGQRFRFGEITTVSEFDGADAELFGRLARIRPGQVYSPAVVDLAITRMERFAQRRGMSLLRVDPRITRNDRQLTLDLELALVRGPRIFVERIDITGNTSTLDRVIRRQFRIVEGDPFNPREIREAAERIRALGLFATTGVNARQGTAEDQIIVDVEVEEQSSGTFSFGAAYNLTTGIGATVKFQDRNLLGRGQSLNLDLVVGLDNANTSITFIEPALLGRDLAFRFDGSYRQTEFDYTDYDTQTLLIRPGIEFPISENGRLGLRYSLSNDKIYNVAAASSPILKAEAATGTVLASAVGYTISYDTRRTGANPDGGVLLRFGQDFAGLGGEAKYIKSTATVGVERRIFNEEVTLRATLEGGALQSFGGNSRLTERFFLNSSDMRGFKPAGVGPRDLTVGNRDALGGNYFAVARFETDFPLGLPEEFGVTGGVFLDIGSLWGLDNTNGGAVDDGFYLRSTAGFSVFWDTPIGPLRLNFSKVLRKQPYDKGQFFDVTISTQF